MALVSVLTRLSRNLKVIRPHYLKSDILCRYTVSHYPRHISDAFGHRSSLVPRPPAYFGHVGLQHVKQYSSEIKANDPDGDHRKLWMLEIAVQVALLGIVPVGFAIPCEIMDDVMAVVFVVHHHWGWGHILGDYASPRNIGAFLATAVQYLNYVLSFVVLAGLFLFNHNDVGIAGAVHKAWEFGKEEDMPPPLV